MIGASAVIEVLDGMACILEQVTLEDKLRSEKHPDCKGRDRLEMNPLTNDLPEWKLPFAQPFVSASNVHVVDFPAASNTESGIILFAWPNCITSDGGTSTCEGSILEGYPASVDVSLLQIFASVFGNGNTSTLHAKLVGGEAQGNVTSSNEQTSLIQSVAASAVSCWVSSEIGRMLCISLSGTHCSRQGKANESASAGTAAETIMKEIQSSLQHLAELPSGSEELIKFNERCISLLKQMNRSSCEFLESEPNLGTRGVYAQWLDHLHESAQLHGGTENLANNFVPEDNSGESAPESPNSTLVELSFFEAPLLLHVLDSADNIWKPLLQKWSLLVKQPLCVVAVPEPQMQKSLQEGRQDRLEKATMKLKQRLEKQHGKSISDVEANTLFKSEYAKAGHAMAMAYNASEDFLRRKMLPRFVSDPPLSSDPQLRFRTESIRSILTPRTEEATRRSRHAKECVEPDESFLLGCFRGMKGAHCGLALSLNQLPHAMLLYIPALPIIFSSVFVA